MWITAAPNRRDPPVTGNGSFNILVVDDDAPLVRLVSVILRSEGFRVTAANGGLEGLQCIAREHPDVILLDLSMPVMDGRMFFARARAAGFLGPVMFCSAYGAQAAQRELGAEGAISKPFEPESLVAALCALLPPTTNR